METVSNEFGETWKKITDDEFVKFVESCLEDMKDNNFSLDYIAKVVKDEIGDNLPNEYQPKDRYIIHVYGGKNGSGKWTEYLKDIYLIFDRLNQKFKKVYLVDISNDCADDVFDMRIAVSE